MRMSITSQMRRSSNRPATIWLRENFIDRIYKIYRMDKIILLILKNLVNPV